MKRRNFLQQAGIVSGALALGGPAALRASAPEREQSKPFSMAFAPHLGMFEQHAGEDPVAQLEFMAERGFRAFEDNEFKGRKPETQARMIRAMDSLNIRMGVFVAHKIHWKSPNLAGGNPSMRREFLDDIRSSIEVALRARATWMTVVPGHVDLSLAPEYQTAHVVDTLRLAAELLEPHGLVMVLEPLNFFNHPGLFLTRIPQAYQICRAVNSPACKILFDIYHQQIQEGNLIPNMELAWDEIAYFQIGDNPGRNEPGTGEINYQNIFRYIRQRGFQGILGMEHGNSLPGKAGELAVIQAYRGIEL
jgi:hydroxypyruvate isomerase